MTHPQQRLYLRLWTEALRAAFQRHPALGWILTPLSIGEQPAEAVFQCASATARQEGRKLSADLLRHSCHVIALGRDKSSKHLNNAEVDRLLACFRLLINPLDLRALGEWNDATAGELRRLDAVILAHPPAYVDALCRSPRFNCADWRTLPLWQRRQLAMTLSARARSRAQKNTPPIPHHD